MARRGPTFKNPTQIGYQREAGLVVAQVHAALREACEPGVTLKELDRVARDTTLEADAEPNFLGYQGFPASVCISLNDVIVHGIPDDARIQDGDLVSFDSGASVKRAGKAWHADSAFTMAVGSVDQKALELDAVTEQAMWAGVAALASARRLDDVGGAIEDYVAGASRSLGWVPGIIEGYTGHGIGNRLHEPPTVYNYRVRGRTERVKPGMVICIEPMLVAGEIDTVVAKDNWAVLTADGEPSSHWEHTVAVTRDGISVLTAPDCGVEGLAPFGVVPVQIP